MEWRERKEANKRVRHAILAEGAAVQQKQTDEFLGLLFGDSPAESRNNKGEAPLNPSPPGP